MQTERTSWPIIFLLWLAGLGAAAQYGKMSVVFDRLPALYPEAGKAIGLTVSLVGATGIVLGVVAGLLVAGAGLRRTLIGGLFVGAAVSLYQATLPSFEMFLVSRLIEGLSHLAIVVAAPTLIARLATPRDSGAALTLWGSFFGVAFALLSFLGVPLAERSGVAALMGAHGIYMAVFAVAVLWLVPADGARVRPQLSLRHMLRTHGRIYASPWISAPGIGWLFYTFCFVSFLTLVPPFIDEAVRAPVMIALPLISIVSSLTLGVFLLRWWPAIRVVLLGFAASAVCAVALAVFPGDPVLCLAFAASLGLIQGASFAAVPQLNEATDARAKANGAMAQTGNIGNTIGTPLLFVVLAAGGAGAMMIGLALALVAGGLAHLALSVRRRQERYV
ncbi:MFS transporter [Aestuariibius insulae]|uniref:MFS transporter n=1 Tax=Aestuariibius insulae TaxID=2058287 RepID=UPI00345F08EB